jgi:hypothetical protein
MVSRARAIYFGRIRLALERFVAAISIAMASCDLHRAASRLAAAGPE